MLFPTFSRAAIEDSLLRIVGNLNLLSHGEDQCGALAETHVRVSAGFRGSFASLTRNTAIAQWDKMQNENLLSHGDFIVALGYNA